MVIVESDFDCREHPSKASKRLHTACPTARATKRRRVSIPREGDGGQLDEADEDYLYFLSLQAGDSGVCSSEDDRDDGHAACDEDPHYKMFLENLKIEGKSYALKVELDGRTVLLNYESERTPSIVVNPRISANVKNDSRKGSVQSGEKTWDERDNSVNALRKADRKKQNNERKNTSKEMPHNVRRNVEVSPEKADCRRNNIGAEANIASTRTKISCGKEFDESVDPHNVRDSAEDEEAWDESLLAFVQCLRNDGDDLIYTHDDGRMLRYEEDEDKEQGSDVESDVEILDREDFSSAGKNDPFELARGTDVINVENNQCGKVPSGSYSEFRAGLISLLEMPYDDKEYDDLMKMVTHRRCKEVDKELRGGREVSYSLKGVCNSYLDIHKDFSKALKRIKGDRKRGLNLLRGFRYWLHNVPKRGSFSPWLDAQCLSLLPGP